MLTSFTTSARGIHSRALCQPCWHTSNTGLILLPLPRPSRIFSCQKNKNEIKGNAKCHLKVTFKALFNALFTAWLAGGSEAFFWAHF